MASKIGTVLKLAGAWLLVPAGLAVAGYYVIGPWLGADSDATNNKPTSQSTEEAGSGSKGYSEPKIEVSVKKGSTVSQSDIRRPRKKKKPVPKPAEPVAPPEAAPPSDGGETVPVGDGTTPDGG